MESEGEERGNLSAQCNDQIMQDDIEEYIPVCDEQLKPFLGRMFSSENEGISFYKKYGAMCGFETRLGTKKTRDGVTTRRYVLCNKEGEKHVPRDGSNVDDDISTVKKRQCVSKRFDCKARIILKFCGLKGYKVDVFVEQHTHCMVSESFVHIFKMNRNVGVPQQKFFKDCARANIGVSKSFKFLNEVMGGFSNIGCSLVDLKNYSRDLKAHVVGADAQMVIDDLHNRRATCSSFSFEYFVSGEHLSRLFWSDSQAQRNYKLFGDAVSFDATYSTNRYNMIFTPFTGRDNHGKCVIFAAGLLSAEDTDSYVWLFEMFKKAMGIEPKMIITDQDPAMKIAVERVFTGTRHRLCMWHIMMKVDDKLPTIMKNDKVFRDGLNKIVWSEYIDVAEFEEEWDKLMQANDLTDHNWFKSMYELRNFWIPAYFKGCSMSGLFRTTSLSESENSFFRRYMNARANLVEFFMHYDRALEYQRYSQDKLNGEDQLWRPELKTRLGIEKHASKVFTRWAFNVLQKEISSATFDCVGKNYDFENTVEHDVNDCVNGVFRVVYDKLQKTISCGCKKFERTGLFCCHVFYQLKEMKIDAIPDEYIVSRWTKLEFLRKKTPFDDESLPNLNGNDECKLITNQIFFEVYNWLGRVDDNKEGLRSMLSHITSGREKASIESPSTTDLELRKSMFDKFYDSPVPKEVKVLPPMAVKTKGSGSRKKSRIEKLIEDSKKPLRKCRKCDVMSHHDSRNCPNK